MSRRLKHLKESHQFFIEGDGSPIMEQTILSLVDEFVLLYPKYINKGHSKQSEIKQIDKHVTISVSNNGFSFKLDIHIHHYTKLYFNIYEYIAKLNAELKLPPASIKYGPFNEDKPKVTSVSSNYRTKQVGMFA